VIPSASARQRLRTLGQVDLGDHIEIATGEQLWSVQKRVATAISQPSAHVAVPSCNSSGKTWLAARIALAFYDAFTPGTPCVYCKGPCRGSKVITTSSKFEHLRDNMWGEIRMSYPKMMRRVGMDGRLYDGDLRLEEGPDHFITGQSAATAEGMQGYHAAHILIIGDEATSVSEEVSQGITGLLASGDARLLLIFNPTTPDTFAAIQARSPRTETIKITAFDTPNFTGEEVPTGAGLINKGFLEDLKAQGMGEGTYEWTTRVLAEFWSMGDDTLIAEEWIDRNWFPGTNQGGDAFGSVRQLGVDLASYGSDENVIALREGDDVLILRAYPSMRMDTFWRGPVLDVIREWGPNYVCYDADGVGAGVIGYVDEVQSQMVNGTIIPFRGAKSVNEQSTNARSAWWWHLRRRFEADRIKLRLAHDPKLKAQLMQMKYSITSGKIRAATKEEMRKLGFSSPDRGDALMYSFALSEDLIMPTVRPSTTPYADSMGVADHSENHLWENVRSRGRRYHGTRQPVNPVFGVPD